jgi:nitroreductase
MVSEVLFVADGVTSPDGKKSVPTARNKQNQRVYAFRKDGVYLYNSQKHSLVKVIGKDLRKVCGKQPFHAIAPLVLVYVSEMTAVGNTPQLQALYSGNHSGHAAQNVYLYAASKNLSTVICGLIDRKLIKDTLKLGKDDMVIFTQPVGFSEE